MTRPPLLEAKALDTAPEGDPNQSPTLTAAATQMGVILGTAAYMSPEQARGKPVNKRADIWAFGCVMFEMLSATKPFPGDDTSQTLARVIDRDPEWTALPATLSPALDTYLRRCLEKDPLQRVHDIGDIRLALAGAFETTVGALPEQAVQPPPHMWQRPIPAAMALLVAIFTGGLAMWSVRPVPDAPPTRFEIPAAGSVGGLALSPDGQTLVYGSTDANDTLILYRRSMDQLRAVPIRGSEDGVAPFFSPDGAWVGFWAVEDRQLRKVPLDGGPPSTLATTSSFSGASWGPDGTIVFSDGSQGQEFGLWLVAEAGGEPRRLTDLEEGMLQFAPQFSPDGKVVVFTRSEIGRGLAPGEVTAYAVGTGEQRSLVAGSAPVVSPTGHLLFMRDDAFLAVPFDTARLELSGDPVPIGIEGVELSPGGMPKLAVAEGGALAYLGRDDVAAASTLVQVGRSGERTALADIEGYAWYPRLSPDGQRVAFAIAAGPQPTAQADVWALDIARGVRTRLTYPQSGDGGNADNNRFYPVWSPDGSQLAFAAGATQPNRILVTPGDGSGGVEVLLDRNERQFPMSWARDGSALALYRSTSDTRRDVYVLPLDGDGTPVPVVVTPFEDRGVSFSPDSRWLAYVSAKSGQDEIYVRPYPGPGREETVSNGGQEAVWGPDGTELFYRNGRQLMVVPVDTTSAELSVGPPAPLFEGDFAFDNASGGGGNPNYDVAPDGQSFIMVARGGPAAGVEVTPITVALNWTQELLALVPLP